METLRDPRKPSCGRTERRPSTRSNPRVGKTRAAQSCRWGGALPAPQRAVGKLKGSREAVVLLPVPANARVSFRPGGGLKAHEVMSKPRLACPTGRDLSPGKRTLALHFPTPRATGATQPTPPRPARDARGARSFSYKSGSSRALQEGGVRSGQATRRPGDSRANSASLQVEKAPDALP